MISCSIAANGLLVVPLICVAANFHFTLEGQFHKVKGNLPLAFSVVGMVCFLLSSVLRVLDGVKPISDVTRFTYFAAGHTHLALYGFFAMAAFAGLYYIVPRLTQVPWPSAQMVRVHFYGSALGIGLSALALVLGGLLQGFRLNNAAVSFVDVVRTTVPFIGISTLGLFVTLVAQGALAANLALLWRQQCASCCVPVLTGWFTRSAAAAGGRG
jgi:cytochrome c oxidase cbb3-type subunit 1